MRWAAWGVAAVVAIVHLLAAGQYGFFVNELYFIVCGRHPAFGYVDQPPLVPLIAAASRSSAGRTSWLLRLPAVLAAVLLVPLVVAFAHLMGASTRGAWLAAIAAASAPMLIAMTSTLTTSTFEPSISPQSPSSSRWAVVCAPIGRAFWWAGGFAGFAFETKYGILIWIAGWRWASWRSGRARCFARATFGSASASL